MQVTKLEKKLISDCYQLKFEDDGLSTIILDEELDPIKVNFHYDCCVEIECKNYTHLVFNERQLKNLISLIKKAEKMLDEKYAKENE